MSQLTIRLLGGFQLIYDGTPITSIHTSRLQALLAYLLLHRHAPQSRQHIAFLFWPDTSEVQARTNLRQLIHNLRSLFPDFNHYVLTDATTIGWNLDTPFHLDVAEFEAALEKAQAALTRKDQAEVRERLEQVVALYSGPLFPGCYDDWLLRERERIEQGFIWATGKLIQLLEEKRDYPTAILRAQRLLEVDPINEEMYCKLMNLYALSGDRASVLSTYQFCSEVLQRELGVEPAPETQETYQRLIKSPLHAIPQHHPTGIIERPVLIGRYSEWEILRGCWHQSETGKAQFVLIRGEAGIGKSRLAEEMLHWVRGQGMRVASTRAYAAGGRLAYAPVVEWLREAPIKAGLAKLDRIWLSEVARLLPDLLLEDPLIPNPEPLIDGFQRRVLFEALVRVICSDTNPLLLVIDDLQWCDQDTLEWLSFLVHQTVGVNLMVIGTARIEEIEADHPLNALVMDLDKIGQLTVIDLEPMDEAETYALAEQIAGRELEDQMLERLFADTEGNPLFVVETIRANQAMERPEARFEFGAQHHLDKGQTLLLPPKVQSVIESRLAHLTPSARELADLAAVIGKHFNLELLLRAGDRPANDLVKSLDELWQHRILREHGTDSFDFSHDRIRDVAYAQISPPRRRWLHKRVADTLEGLNEANPEAISGLLAAHYEEAGVLEKAIANCSLAGAFAQRMYANQEALKQYEKGLELLKRLPESHSRAIKELALQLVLGQVCVETYGYASSRVERAMSRAQELSQQLGETVQLFHALFGLLWVQMVRGNLRQSYTVAIQLSALAQGFEQPIYSLAAHYSLGGTLCFMGEFEAARRKFEEAIVLYKSRSQHSSNTFLGIDLGIFCQSWISHALWHLGYSDQALQSVEAALVEAQETSQPYSQAIALAYGAMLHQYRGERAATQEWAAAAIDLCTKHGYSYYLRWCAILEGWAAAMDQPGEKSIAHLRQCLADFEATEAGARLPYYYSLLAEVCAKVGDVEAAQGSVQKALEIAQRNEDHGWTAEIYRMIGEFSLAGSKGLKDVEESYMRAIQTAQKQQSKSLELRAILSLCRLWKQQNRGEQASHLLAGVLSSFTEGFEMEDLVQGKHLVEEFALS
jgi:DNA-binding SARP family transcriptional activator/predicted ATPase